MLDDPIAPSPVVPTYRPFKTVPSRRLRLSIMPSVAIEEPQVFPPAAALQRLPPRSAGASNRATRSENISELVRFFQTQQRAQENPMNIIKHDGAMDLFKAGQRRLRQLGQAKPDKRMKGTESPVPSEKGKAKRQHLLALQREGLLPSTDDTSDTSRPSRTKQDVEAMGRPWLDDALSASNAKDGGSSTSGSLRHLRSESLGLGDLAALVEFSVSFPEFSSEEPGPPPYQAQAPKQDTTGPAPTTQASSEERHQNKGTINDDSRPLGSLVRPQGRDSTTAPARPALNQLAQPPAPSSSINKTVDRQPQRDDEHGRGHDDRCCGSDHDCDCNDAKSLAVLLRATERLEREKKKASQNPTPPQHEAASGAGDAGGEPLPHSLNQGVTDTPLFVKGPDPQVKPEKTNNNTNNSNAFRETPSLLFSFQGKSSLTKSQNAGPIPLKLVAECLPPRGSSKTAVSKSASPQLLNSRNDSFTLLQPPHSTGTPTASSFPRPQALLSPFPNQSRRARSVTPDVASDSKGRKKKKPRISPLYVVNTAPLPPPTKPLPSVPQSTDVSVRNHPADQERKMSTPSVTPTPDQSRGKEGDSPTLGSIVHKSRLRRSMIGPRPSSRYSIRSNDTSEAIFTASDDHSTKTVSPARSSLEALDDVRRGRADKVHAIRLRDLGAKKDQKPAADSESQQEAKIPPRNSNIGAQADTVGQGERAKRDKRHRASAAPRIPLPSDPPIIAYDTQSNRRRGSTSSLPGSISTINGYGGGLSRSVSVTSGSIASSSIHRGKLAHITRDAPVNLRHTRPDSPSLPSSDDESQKPRTRYSQGRLDIGTGERRAHQHSRRSDAGRSISNVGGPPLRPSDGKQASPQTPRSHSTLQSRHSYAGYTQSIHYLEARVAMLERQNKMLQAALLAALDIGVSHDAESVRSGTASPALESTRIPTINETSMPWPSRMSFDETNQTRKISAHRRYPTPSHRSWASGQDHTSQESRGSFETSSSHSDASMRAVENLLSDVDVEAPGEP